MNKETFFENLETMFEDQDDEMVDTLATIVRKEGKILEIRVINDKFDDILVIPRKGETFAINADEFRK